MSALQTISMVCFVLSPLLAVASVVVFVRMNVMDAIRFLRRRSQKGASAPGGSPDRVKRASRKRGGTGSAKALSQAALGSASAKTSTPSQDSVESVGSMQGATDDAPLKVIPSSTEQETDILDFGDAASECATTLLSASYGCASEADTGLLDSDGDSEGDTCVLDSDGGDAECPADVLLVAEGSEADTRILADVDAAEPSESNTCVLGVGNQDAASGFMFKLKSNIVVVHTDEAID